MESVGLKTLQATRLPALDAWLRTCGLQDFSLEALPFAASFRRYFRVRTPQTSYIAMDAPPPENCLPFVTIGKGLREQNILVPEIFEQNLTSGFLLLTDFGDATYLSKLTNHNAPHLYQRALSSLTELQACNLPNLPLFNFDFMMQEWSWHQEWFLEKLLNINLSQQQNKALTDCYEWLVAAACNQPQVLMHRDFHSANLMVVGEKVGILDFQDAFQGPLTYDVVSLLRDCYVDWPKPLILDLAKWYLEQLQAKQFFNQVTLTQFLTWFDLMSVQRHLKALLTFARKKERDGESRYLQFIPRTLNYLLDETKDYVALKPLHDFLQNEVITRALTICAR